MMNRKPAFALVLAAAFGGAASAEDITLDPTPFTSVATRAQVQAELASFQQSGVNPWSKQFNPLASFTSDRTRAQVVAEYLAQRDRVAAFTGEDSGSAYLARHDNRLPGATRVAGQPITAE